MLQSDQKLDEKMMGRYNDIMDTMGVMMHHDAITGTAKQFVADDYKLKMTNSINSVNAIY